MQAALTLSELVLGCGDLIQERLHALSGREFAASAVATVFNTGAREAEAPEGSKDSKTRKGLLINIEEGSLRQLAIEVPGDGQFEPLGECS